MIKPIFYTDSKIISYEIIGRWFDTVEYMEKLFEENKCNPIGEEVLCHAIFQCWHAIVNLPDTQFRYLIFQEYDYYKEKWKHFVSIGIDKYYNSASVCWIIGYTCYTCNMFFPHLKRFGEDMMKRGLAMSPKEWPFDILMGKRRKNKNEEYYVVPSKIFPADCAADNYFRGILTDAGIED